MSESAIEFVADGAEERHRGDLSLASRVGPVGIRVGITTQKETAMRPAIYAAFFMSLAIVANAQDRPSWDLSGNWRCVMGCDPGRPTERQIVQEGANLSFSFPAPARSVTAKWMGSDRVYVEGLMQYMNVIGKDAIMWEGGTNNPARWERQ